MQKFYIHKNNQPHGPFSVLQLKEENISHNTMVWFEGADDWEEAHKIGELSEVFKSVPPPFAPRGNSIPPLQQNVSHRSKNASEKYSILIVIAVLLIGGLGVYIYSNQMQQDSIRSTIQDQGMIINDQQDKLLEQERIEEARILEENQRQRAAQLESLRGEYDNAVNRLRGARLQLEEIQKIHLLRMPSEKQQQIQDQLEVIRSWENEVQRLQAVIQQY